MIEFSQKFLFSENLYSYFLGISIVYRTNNNPLSISRRPDVRLGRMEYESVILPMVATYRDLNLNGRPSTTLRDVTRFNKNQHVLSAT